MVGLGFGVDWELDFLLFFVFNREGLVGLFSVLNIIVSIGWGFYGDVVLLFFWVEVVFWSFMD